MTRQKISLSVAQEICAAAFAWCPEQLNSFWTVVQLEVSGFMDGYRGKPWRKRKLNTRAGWEAGAFARHLSRLGSDQS